MKIFLTTITIAIVAIAGITLFNDSTIDEHLDQVSVGTDTLTETYFAEIAEDGTVLRVIVADQAFIDSGAVGDPKNWIETFKEKDYLSKDDKIDKTSKKKIPKIETPVIFDSQVATSTL